MPKPIASLSLDLDNKWSYMKTHGDAGWEKFPSYLDIVVPRVLLFLEARDQKITFFIVGQDAALEQNHVALASIGAAGHEIGNHSFHHEPWLHLYTPEQLEFELAETERLLEQVTGQVPIGFRGPGFSHCDALLKLLARRGYLYDASTFPTFLGPLARAYYFLTSRLDKDQKEERKVLFGRFNEGFKRLKPYRMQLEDGAMWEMPVTTMPLFKIPIHVSYLLYLMQFSTLLARAYWKWSLSLCRMCGVAPSLLLHPLDFMGCDDDRDLDFFPAMRSPSEKKVAFVGEVIDEFRKHYDVRTMREHAESLAAVKPRAQVKELARQPWLL